MTQAIGDLVDTAAPGDVLYLHYSGHGSNVPDTNGDEDDRRPRRDPLPARPRLERPAHRRLAADDVRPARPRRVAHRRHGLLPLRQQHPRAAPAGRAPARGHLALPAQPRRRGARRRVHRHPRRRRRRGASDVHDVDIVETLVSGCRDDQTSADAHIDGASTEPSPTTSSGRCATSPRRPTAAPREDPRRPAQRLRAGAPARGPRPPPRPALPLRDGLTMSTPTVSPPPVEPTPPEGQRPHRRRPRCGRATDRGPTDTATRRMPSRRVRRASPVSHQPRPLPTPLATTPEPPTLPTHPPLQRPAPTTTRGRMTR